MSDGRRVRAIGAWIAVGTAALCLLTAGGSMTTTDAVVAFDLTQSLVDRHSIATSGDLIGNEAYRGVDGRYYSPFGIAQSVWNVPFYAVGRTIAARIARPETAAAMPKAIVTLGTIPAVALLAWCTFAILVSLGAATPALAWGGYNWIRFGSPLQSGYLRDQAVGWGGSPLAGAAGLLFSSYASLFLYCPIVLLSAAGLAALWRRNRAAKRSVAAIFLAFFALYASVGNWMGGRAYGPRYLVPFLPALVLPLAWWRPASRASRIGAAVIIALSVAVQLPGVLVDYAKVRVSLARAGETVAQDMRWSRTPLLLNARAAAAVVPPALASLVGLRPVDRVPRGAGRLDEALADGPDLWWNSLLRLGVIGRGTAIAIASALLAVGVLALGRAHRLAVACDRSARP